MLKILTLLLASVILMVNADGLMSGGKNRIRLIFANLINPCEPADKIYDEESIDAYLICTYRKIGVLNDDDTINFGTFFAFLWPYSSNRIGMEDFSTAVQDCGDRDSLEEPLSVRIRELDNCIGKNSYLLNDGLKHINMS